MDPWDLLAWGGSAGFVACLLPQLVRTLRRRSADDFSIPYLLLVLAASGMMLPYLLHLREYVLAVSQVFNLVVWGVVLYYRVFPSPRRG